MKFLKKFFKSYHEKELNRIKKAHLNKINSYENSMKNLSDEELKAKTNYFKEKLKNGESIDNLLDEAFAVVREASGRVLNMRHFDVQILCGIILHQGRIAEMKTGEGKTLTATLPIYLNALTEEKVFVVTVNEYLAERDSTELKPLFDFLGITVSFISDKHTLFEKANLYKSDVIYITNSELGFDYLRDNMVKKISNKIQPSFAYAIVDEVDSVLIDDARTPLVISSPSDSPTELYGIIRSFVASLNESDYEIFKDSKVCLLSATGVSKAEKIFGLENYSDLDNNNLRHYINMSLKAFFSMKKDVDYIVKNDKVLLIDEGTGRIAEGRRYSDGLHQSIEAKENVTIERETDTFATITYQNFFKLFSKLSGMTGTGITQQYEFNEIYNLDVISIPTNKPVLREDKPDLIFISERVKNKAIIEDIKANYRIGRPVLVGTLSVSKSEQLSNLLTIEGVKHNLLNAKNHELEANIIRDAGKKGAVTIATNMAGRGTDIKLDEEVLSLGGLKVIGTEKADNRRIDNQLRGRSGRQGDRGESQFYASFDDTLIAFATEKNKTFLEGLDKKNDKPVTNVVLLKIIDSCQKQLETAHFEQRKNVVKYNNITDFQRELLYNNRNKILRTTEFIPVIKEMVDSLCETYVDSVYNEFNETLIEDIIGKFEPEFFTVGTLKESDLIDLNRDSLINLISTTMFDLIIDKYTKVENCINIVSPSIILDAVDNNWKEQINDLLNLRKDLGVIRLTEIDPLQIYSKKAHELFEEKMINIQKEVLLCLLTSTIHS